MFDWLFSGCLACCLLLPIAAQAYDRVAAGEAYRQWLQQFLQDQNTLARALRANPQLDPAEVDRLCAASVAPHSRMSQQLLQLTSQSVHQGNATVSGEIVFYGPLYLLNHMLADSLPAGDGGAWPEPLPEQFSTPKVRAVYMHIHAGDHLADYFADPEIFAPSYHLPADGVLERKAYPFLNFQIDHGHWRLAAIGSEYWNAVAYLSSQQYQ